MADATLVFTEGHTPKPFVATVRRILYDQPPCFALGDRLWWHMANTVARRQEQHLSRFPRVSATFALPSGGRGKPLKSFMYAHVDRAARILTARVRTGKTLKVSVIGEPCRAVVAAVQRALDAHALGGGDYFVHYVVPADAGAEPLLFGTTHILPRRAPEFDPYTQPEDAGVAGVDWGWQLTDNADMVHWVRPRDDERTFIALEHRLTRDTSMYTLGEMGGDGAVTRVVWDALHATHDTAAPHSNAEYEQ